MAVEPSGRAPDQFDPDHRWQQERQRLSEHRRFGLDATNSPAEHAETVDHRRVRVGSHERVGVRGALAVAEHDLTEVLEVHLVADALIRREHAQRAERALRPPEERVALLVARELERGVARERIGHSGDVDHDGVVDDEIDGDRRVDTIRIAAEIDERVPHRREVDDGGNTGEVLHQHACGHERELAPADLFGGAVAIGERADVVGGHLGAVFATDEVLQQDAQRVRQAAGIGDDGVESVDRVVLTTDAQALTRAECVERHSLTLAAGSAGTLRHVERQPPTGLSVTVEHIEERAVMVVAGEVEYATAPMLRNALAEIARSRPVVLVIDLEDVTFMDSTGVSLLLQAKERCETDRSRLVLRRPSARVLRILDVSGLTALFEIDARPT